MVGSVSTARWSQPPVVVHPPSDAELRGVVVMTNHLQELVEAARRVSFPSEEREAQRRSFAYGNTHIENERITREMVDEQAESLKASHQSK
jgi:hypothetical protein